MASEILRVPEQHLEAVIAVIRIGLRECFGVPDEVEKSLADWCDEEERYLARLTGSATVAQGK